MVNVDAWLLLWVRWSGHRDLVDAGRLGFKSSGIEYRIMLNNGVAPIQEARSFNDRAKSEIVQKLWTHFYEEGYQDEMAAVRIYASRGFSRSAVRKHMAIPLSEANKLINVGRTMLTAGITLIK